MDRLKSATTKTDIFQLVSTVIVIGLIVIAELVMISENAAFLQTQGKSPVTAFALSTCVALLIPVVPGLLAEDRRNWVLFGKWIFVISLITMQVYFASQTAIAPQLEQMVSSSEKDLINDYKDQLKQYDQQIEVYQKHIDSYPDKFRTKRAKLSSHQLKLIEDRRKVLADLRSITQKSSAQPENLTGILQHLTILITILYRLALEIGVVILTCSLKGQFSPPLPQADDLPASSQADSKLLPAPKNDLEKPVTSPKIFVRSIYPESFCKSKNGTKGPFVVYSNRKAEIEIAKAKNPHGAWSSAAKKLRMGTVLKKKNRKVALNTPKVYAIKS